MPDYLPRDMMQAEDDQLLAELDDRTMSDIGLDSPTAKVADLLDPQYEGGGDESWRRRESRALNDGELHILLLYAQLGRNVFLRHQEDTAPEIEEPHQ